MTHSGTVLVVGATGSIGRLVVEEVLAAGHDYAGVRNVLTAISGRPVRIALMTAIGVTDRDGAYNRSTQAHDWKRRSERVVRASGHPYMIVRPGWFDYNAPRSAGWCSCRATPAVPANSSDGVIARRQIAQVLVTSLGSAFATRKTFELVAEHGRAQADLEPVRRPRPRSGRLRWRPRCREHGLGRGATTGQGRPRRPAVAAGCGCPGSRTQLSRARLTTIRNTATMINPNAEGGRNTARFGRPTSGSIG
jgi:uncharacterized protein YbjT (DUF2867 family)